MSRCVRRPLRYRGVNPRSEEEHSPRAPKERREWVWQGILLLIIAAADQTWEYVGLGAGVAVLVGGSLVVRLAKGFASRSARPS